MTPKEHFPHPLIAILCRACFFGYWVFDNLLIFAKINILQKDKKQLNTNAMRFWCFANTFSIIGSLKKLQYIGKRQAYIKKLLREDPAKREKFVDDLKNLKKAKNKALLAVIKSSGDFLTSFNGAGKNPSRTPQSEEFSLKTTRIEQIYKKDHYDVNFFKN